MRKYIERKLGNEIYATFVKRYLLNADIWEPPCKCCGKGQFRKAQKKKQRNKASTRS